MNAGQLQCADAVEAERLMRCCNRQPARLQMRAHQVGKQPVGTLVECRSGFIEQPQGPGTDQQPRQRDAPLLTGGEIAERQMRHAKSENVPESAPSNPARIRSRVDLPDPLGPVITSASPRPSVKPISSNSTLSPRRPLSFVATACIGPRIPGRQKASGGPIQ